MHENNIQMAPPSPTQLISTIALACPQLSPEQLGDEIEMLFFDHIDYDESHVVSVNLSALPPAHAEALLDTLMKVSAQNGMSIGMPFLDRLSDYAEKIVPMELFAITLISKHLMTKVVPEVIPKITL